VSTPRVKALLKERKRRDAFPDAVDAVIASLFPRQREFVLSPAKRKENHAGRRSGKTNGAVARAFMKAHEYPGCVIPVFERTLTCVSAESFWQLLQEFDQRFKLGVKFHHTLKTASMPNASTISLLGADTIEAADKHRGGKHPLVIVDEAGTYRSKVLEYLLTDVAEPATMDYDGEIMVLGTPGLVPTGAWYTITQSSGWEHSHWDVRDNPTLGPADLDAAGKRAWRINWLDALRHRHGWTEDTPRYRREYLGLWTTGLDDQIYRYDRNRNLIADLPYSAEWTYALAMDLGFNDPTAFVVWARRPGDPNKYVVESYEQSGLIPSAVAAHVERLRSRYSFRSIVADTGGYGKAVAEEMVQRHNIPVRAAAKRDKRIYIEHTNGDLVNGRIKIVARTNQTLIEDLTTLGWDDDRQDSNPGSRDHLPDAFLYGDREIRSWWDGGEREGPRAGSEEWFAAKELEIEETLMQQHRQAREPEDGEDDWREQWYAHDAA
jgi:hypothetical protein